MRHDSVRPSGPLQLIISYDCETLDASKSAWVILLSDWSIPKLLIDLVDE